MISIKREDHEFLLSSAKFCNRIEEYACLFDLDTAIVNAYRYEDKLLAGLLENPTYEGRGFEYFIARKIREMKAAFNYLVELCKGSEHYTEPIGRYLGIEDEEGEYWFSEN